MEGRRHIGGTVPYDDRVRVGAWVVSASLLMAASAAGIGASVLQWSGCFARQPLEACLTRYDQTGTLPLLGSPGMRPPGTEVLGAATALLMAAAWYVVAINPKRSPRTLALLTLPGLQPLVAGGTVVADLIHPGAAEPLLNAWWFYLVPELLVVVSLVAVGLPTSGGRRRVVRAAAAGFAVSSFGLGHLFVEGLATTAVYPWSWDTPPGTGLGISVGLAGCGIAILASLAPQRRRAVDAGPTSRLLSSTSTTASQRT